MRSLAFGDSDSSGFVVHLDEVDGGLLQLNEVHQLLDHHDGHEDDEAPDGHKGQMSIGASKVGSQEGQRSLFKMSFQEDIEPTRGI